MLLAALTGHRDRFDRRGLFGLVLGLFGVAVLLGLDVGPGTSARSPRLGLVAVGYATGPLLASRYLGHLSSLALAAVSLALVAVAYAPVAVWQRPERVPPGTTVAAVVVLGLVCTALAFVAFFELIKEVGSTRATVITYVNPAVAVVLGVFFLGEQFKVGTGSWLRPDPGRIVAVDRPPGQSAEAVSGAPPGAATGTRRDAAQAPRGSQCR